MFAEHKKSSHMYSSLSPCSPIQALLHGFVFQVCGSMFVTFSFLHEFHVIYREAHKEFYEKSAVFILCMLQPLSFEIQKQESEIEDAKVIFG